MFLAEGFEDIEALATRDILIRAGIEVNLIAVDEEPFVISAHGLTVGVDEMLCDIEPENGCGREDMMIFPGGMPGSKNLGDSRKLIDLMNAHYKEGGSVAAICAAPKFVLSQLEGIGSAEFTCYEGCQDTLMGLGAKYLRRPAVTCGRIITGRGPGYANDFALAIVRHIKGADAAAAVAAGLSPSCE